MGSSWSSSEKKENYTVDSAGKISRVPRHQPGQTDESLNNKETKQDSTSEKTINPIDLDSLRGLELEADIVGQANNKQTTAKRDNMAQSRGTSDQLRLQELDEILNRMKAKYKPNSIEMAGKNKSMFEDIERNLLHCYKVNKDQALKCASLSEEYRLYVAKQQTQTLVSGVKS